MRLVVITPVGPGHEEYVRDCIDSVRIEKDRIKHAWRSIEHKVIDDTEGKLGRSKARNIGLEIPADWYFFLDADDRMAKGCLELCDCNSPATFGAIAKIGGEHAFNVHPCGWREVALFGCYGTLSMGFFYKGGLRFNENLNAGEDYEFYMRLPSFTKVAEPLAEIGYQRKSASGPKGYRRLDWITTCNEQIKRAVEREPNKYDLDGCSVLEKRKHPKGQFTAA